MQLCFIENNNFLKKLCHLIIVSYNVIFSKDIAQIEISNQLA